jgi:RNA polymerase sigma-B factor
MLDEATSRDQRDKKLLNRYRKRGDRDAYDELVARFTGMVRSFARKYADRGEELEDLVQVGMLGLVKAIDGFDPSRPHRFVSYAAPTISGEIKRHFRDRCWSVNEPRSVKELQARVSAEERRLTQTGQTATTAELAGRLQTTEDQIQEARRAVGAFTAGSLSAPTGEGREKLDTMGRADHGYDRVEDVDLVADAMTALDDRDRAVVRMRFRDELLQREIGERIDISQMQVSRILDQATRRMRRHLEPDTA